MTPIKVLENLLKKPIFWSLGVNFISLSLGTLTIFCVSSYFDSYTQGIYFTFTSLGMLQFVAEFGLGQTIIQLTKHYCLNLNGRKYKLFISSIKIWFHFSSILLFAVFLLIPLFVQLQDELGNNYKIEWYIFSLSIVINYCQSKELYLFQGSNMMLEYWRFRFSQFLIYSLILLGLIVSEIGIISIVIANVISTIINFIFITRKISRKKIIISESVEDLHDIYRFWKNEIANLQCKIAITWLGSNVVNRFITPIILSASSASLAGQYGMSISLASICFSISVIVMNLKIPTLSTHVVNENFEKLEKLFYRGIVQGCIIFFIIMLCEILFINILNYFDLFDTSKILNFDEILILIGVYFLFLMISFISTYLRSFKKDSVAIYSLVANAVILLTSFSVIKNNEFIVFLYLYFAVILIQFLLSYRSFYKFRCELLK